MWMGKCRVRRGSLCTPHFQTGWLLPMAGALGSPLLHRGPNPLPLVSVTTLPPKTHLRLLGYVGWTRSHELRALLTSPCPGRRNLPVSADQVSQTLQLVLNAAQTSPSQWALPPNLPVSRACITSLLNADSKSTSLYCRLATGNSFYNEGLEGSMS